MENEPKSRELEASGVDKKAYTQPALKRLGTVRELTQTAPSKGTK